MRQQRNMLQMKEENKEEQLSEVEIGNFLKKNSE